MFSTLPYETRTGGELLTFLAASFTSSLVMESIAPSSWEAELGLPAAIDSRPVAARTPALLSY